MKKSKKRRLAGLSAGRTIALAAAVLAAGLPAQAADTALSQTVASSGGKALFELLYYAKGNGPEGERHSVRNPSSAEMQGIASGWKIWADVLGPTAANREACTVDVVMEADVGNARCGSDIEDPDGGMTLLGEAIVNGSPDRGSAFMGLGVVTEPGSPAPVPPHTPYGEIYSTTVHEAGHGLGLTSSIGSTPIGKTPLLSILDSHLFSKGTGGELRLRDVKDISQVVRVVKDEKGTTYYLPRAVDMPGGGKAYSWTRQVQAGDLPEGAFLVGELSNSGVFFSGPETTTTLNAHGDSGLPGVRIEGFESNDKDSTGSYVYTPDLSHLELAHSMMSHQNYRNYNFFMEAELAVLKDLGYRIDLKRFYGASIYGNNLNVVNDAPFYARRSDGRGWLEGQPSEETFGVGLHVYGEHNSVLQRADLLTKGEAAVGVRIDGARTTLGIPAGVRVHADGTNGAGLLVAYGRDTEIAVLGEIRARGEGGVAARFDFGGNYIGDKAEIRGSYMHRVPDEMGQLKEGPLKGTDDAGYQLHLDGPLVKTFNVAGELEGSAAAIYMSENAFVQEINILTGAAVSGDIISHWDAKNPLLQAKKDSLYTSLVFGRKRGNGGEAGEPDRDFDMTLEGSIDGPKGIDMELRAGRLIVEGETHVHNMTNSGWLGVTGLKSTLVGTVSGSFTQTKDGVLQSWVTPDGTSTNLQASGGSAQGRWAVTPDKGYWVHRKAVPLTNAPVFFGDGTKTAFSGSLLAESSSLTLAFGLLDASGSRPVIGAFRAADAYSRLATRDSGAAAGRALSLANRGVPSSRMQALVTELDFMDSRAAIDRALSQLSADSFSEAFAHALGRQQALSQRLLARMLSQLPKGTAAAGSRNANASGPAGRTGLAAGDGTEASGRGWTVWGSLFGMADNQSAYGSSDGWYSTGCGLMGGADKDLGDGLSAGFDLALVSDRFEAGGRQDADASSQGLFLGVHGSFAPDAWNGAYLLGGVRFGFDVNRMQRSVNAGAYHRSHDSEWTDWSGAFMLGAGWDWFFGEEKSVRLGPLATIQYAFTSHPDFEEDGGAEALRIDGGTADSLAFLLGAHLGASKEIGSGCRLDAELMAGWRHELLEGTIRTRAAFAENPSATFTSARRLNTRDAGVLQASLRIAHESGCFAELDLGGEARTAGAGVTGGLRVGFEF